MKEQLRKAYLQIPWKDMAGVRDKIIHHYFGLNYEIVWAIAKEEIRGLLPQIEDILTKKDR